MVTITRRTTVAGIVMLLIGIIITSWVTVWSVTPLRQVDRMSEDVDRAIRRASEQFDAGTPVTSFQRAAGDSSSSARAVTRRLATDRVASKLDQ